MDCLVESCTIHDDLYLNFNDLYETNQISNGQNLTRSFESANAYSYNLANDYRFIIWRINGNKLELIEHSLVYKLEKNSKRINFNNSFIVPNIYCTKFEKTIQILVTTSTALYRFIFPLNINDSQNSIFHNITSADLFQNESNIYPIDLKFVDYSSNFLTTQGEALFTFQTQNKSLCCIKLPPNNTYAPTSPTNLISKIELNQPNLVQRIVSSLKKQSQDTLVAYKLISIQDVPYIVSLCVDFKIKIWNLRTSEAFVENLTSYVKFTDKILIEESKIDVKQIDNQRSSLIICFKKDDQFLFYNFNLKSAQNQVVVTCIGSNIINNKESGKLVDVYLNEQTVWITYKNDDNEFKISYLNLNLIDGSSNDLIMDQRDDKDDEITFFGKDVDHKEAYLKSIFEPFRFSKLTICKALSILRQSVIRENEIPESLNVLKEKIIETIENEVRNYPNIQNCTEEDEFLDITCKCWSKFYSILLQYDYDSRLPLGLFVDNEKSFVFLIRKNSVSLFTQADLTTTYSQRELLSNAFFKNHFDSYLNRNTNDRDLRDINHLFDMIKLVNDYFKVHLNEINDESNVICENFVSNNGFITQVTEKLLSSDSDFCESLQYILNKFTNFDFIIKPLKLLLEYFNASLETHDDSNEMELDTQDSTGCVINSEFTINSLIASYRQLIRNRYDFLRSLLISIKIIVKSSDKFQMSVLACQEIDNDIYLEFMNHYNSYEVLKWLCDIYPYSIHKSNLEKNLRRTGDLLDTSLLNRNASLNYSDYDNVLLKSFLQIFGRNVLNSHNVSLVSTHWLPSILKDFFKLTWPTNQNNDLIKYFMYNVQYIHLNNYCILMKWWNNGKNLRYFLLAHCCLNCEDIDKSVDLFLKASLNLENDLILSKFLNFQNLTNKNELSINYYIKIINYYKLNGNIDAIIDLIHKAILHKNETNRSRLYCILFKSYMDLEYYENAFEALMTNTDIEWKRNCLKQFIIELCNQNKASELIKFDYSYMQQYVKETLYKRAKSSDLRTHDFYSLLYAFYIKNNDYRKAASSMYEYAIRLKNEITGLQSLKKQEKCYLTCLNTLKLINKEFAFITIPSDVMSSAMRTHNNEFGDGRGIQQQQNGEILVDYDEINRNYLIVHYLLKVTSLQSNQSSIATFYSVDELVGLLVKQGLFDDAIVLCLAFKSIESSPLVNIFNGLVDRCCKVIQTTSANEFELEYEWLKYNESLPVSIIPYEKPESFKWKLLHIYLEKYNDAVYYKTVCKRLLTLGYEIPNNIISSFKKVNSNALLQILINFGLLNEAYDLVIDYMTALITNNGIENFDIKNTIQSYNYPVVMPYTSIDQLIIALEQSGTTEFKILHEKLIEKLDNYFELATNASAMKLTRKFR